MAKLQAAVAELQTAGPASSRDLRAGGSTRERSFATVAWLRSQGIDTAPHLSCIGPRARRPGDPAGLRGRGNPPRGRPAAATCRPAWASAGSGSFGTRTSWWPSSARVRRPLPRRGRGLSGVPPAGADAEKDLANFKRKVERARARRSPSTSSTGRLPAVRRELRAAGARYPDRAGLMRSPTTRSSRASPTRAARRSRAGCAALEGFGDDRASIRAFGVDVVTPCARACSPRARPACTSTR